MRRIACICCLIFASSSFADLKLHSLFTDRAVVQRDQPVPVWGSADPNSQVTISFRDAKVVATTDGAGQWKAQLPSQAAGGPDDLKISSGDKTITVKDILVGEVWLCSGQSNMEWPLRKSADPEHHIAQASHPKIRLFFVPLRAIGAPQSSVNGTWRECTPETAANFSAVAYFFGRDLQKRLNVPIGLIQSTWGGTPAQAWTSEQALEAEPSLKFYCDDFRKQISNFEAQKSETPKAPKDPRRAPNATTLYNGMIAPLIPFRIAGAIWYQGESNGSRGHEYRTLFPTMIQDWRTRWGCGDFPFLCVQLAPFAAGNADGPQWAELREAQWLTAKKLPRVGMAVTTDVGDKDDVHPLQKEPIGARLALLAQSIAHGENLVAYGPMYKSMKIEGNRAALSFDSVGSGLEARGGELRGFTICGADDKFVPAKAEIKEDRVVVWSDAVETPVAVRYGWKNCPDVNLFNKNGLPASPFRTDDMPLTSQRR